MIRRRHLLAAPAALAIPALPAGAQAQAGRLTMVLPFPPGGAADRLGRGLAEFMRADLGQQVVVDNRPGAASMLGAEYVLRQPRDGATMLWAGWSTITINLIMMRNPPYRVEDWAPLTAFFSVPLAIAVAPGVPVSNFAELVAFSRARNGVGYAHSGVGSASQLFIERLRLTRPEVVFEQVPFPGEAPAATAVLGGHVPVYIGSAATILEHVRAGRLRVVATTNPTRMAALPDVTTMVEQGWGPTSAFTYWHGMVMAVGTPEPAMARLHASLVSALGDATVRSRMGEDMTPWPLSREEFGRQIRQDVEEWTPIIRRANLTME